MWRAGIIGCGRIGCEFEDCHARAYMECHKTNLVALCDSDYRKFKQPDLPILEVSTDYKHLVLFFKARGIPLDIISVCTPPETHCQIVCDIAPYVKAVYCEKPIATTVEDAEKMIETCHKHNVILQVNHQRRFGRPTFYYSRGIENTGTHMFDLLRMYFGNAFMVAGNTVYFKSTGVDIVEVGTDEPVFEFKVPTEGLILKGVEHLVKCLETGKQSISSGEEALEALRLVERFKQCR